MDGYKFRRQYSISHFIIVDFYCPALKLAIEPDGNSRYTGNTQLYDEQREELIKSYSIHVLRFTNIEIYQNLDGVLLKKWSELDK